MKKLMFGLACAAGLMAVGDVSSANIVGYNAGAVEGFAFVGPSFTKVGGATAFKYSDIVVNCDETGEGGGSGWQPLGDSIVILNENGSFVRKLVYLPQFLADGFKVPKGWYEENAASDEDFSNCLNDEELEFGYGVQVSATAGANATVQFAGEVKGSPTVIDVENFVAVGNCAPKALKLADIVVNCDETGEGGGSGWQPLLDSIVMLNENGSFVRKLVYLPQFLADDFKVSKGWYEENAASEEDFTDCWNDRLEWAIGEGFQVSATVGAGATITIKSALAE